MANAETITGAAAATKSEEFDHCIAISCPPKTGPNTEPILPIPNAQPMPVERSDVG